MDIKAGGTGAYFRSADVTVTFLQQPPQIGPTGPPPLVAAAGFARGPETSFSFFAILDRQSLT
jgi:hypothetical protein